MSKRFASSPPEGQEAKKPRHLERVAPLVLFTTSLGFVMVQLDVSIVNVALVRIATDLGVDITGLQWVVDAYAIVFASLLLSAGALGDRIGHRRVFNGGMALFSLASLACGLAPNAATLVAARALQGIGAATLVPCSLALLNHAAAGSEGARSRAIGWWTAAGGAALAAGPLLGGLLVGALGWRAIFFVNLPIGLAAIWLTSRLEEDAPSSAGRGGMDLIGQAFAILTLLAITGTAIEAGPRGWLSTVVLGGAVVALAAGAVFLSVEARGTRPMLPLHLFRNRRFSAATAIGLAFNMTVYGLIFVLSLHFQRDLGYSPIVTGLAFLPFMLLVVLTNIVAGSLTSAVGSRIPIVAGASIGVLGCLLLAALPVTAGYTALLPRLLLIPAGIGLAVPAMTSAMLASVPKQRSGLASGVLNMARQAGGAFGVALFGAFTAADLSGGLRRAYLVSAGLLAVAVLLGALCIGGKAGSA